MSQGARGSITYDRKDQITKAFLCHSREVCMKGCRIFQKTNS